MNRIHQKIPRSAPGQALSGERQRPNLLLTLLATLFITGVIIGAVCSRNAGGDLLEKLLQVIENYTEIRTKQSMTVNFGNSFAAGMFFLLFLYLVGMTAWGVPAALILPLFKGMGYGMVCGTLYADYAARGFGYAALVILPGTLISTLAILVAAKESIRFSSGIFTQICLSREKRSDCFRDYSIRFLILILFILIASFVDMITIRLFSGMFL